MAKVAVPDDVVRGAIDSGICVSRRLAGARKELESMVRSSAHITHPLGNRRYEEWVFRVVDGELISVHGVGCEQCDQGVVIVYDDDAPKRIPCPLCQPQTFDKRTH